MSDPIGTYTFLPWIRLGISNQIVPGTASARAAVDISFDVEATTKGGAGTTTHTIPGTAELYGPGDVIGLDGAQISRLEPPHWTTNFEPNYLVAVEFYDEDFPWRYTPAAPEGGRLLPWLALIVLEEGTEFNEGTSVESRPLPFIEVTASFADVFADPTEGWAWAHAHFNAEWSTGVVENDADKVAQRAANVIDSAPDTACSRLLCPRKLKPKTGYHAFLVPAFESGRLAGLGHDPKPLFDDAANGLSATSSAWDAYATPANRPEPNRFPVYHRFYFRTAEQGDFESLVRLLKPKVVDSRVGYRDMDVTDPAPNITGIEDAELGGVLRLGGALRAPLDTLGAAERQEYDKYDQWATPYPHVFQTQLAAFINLSESYQKVGPAANEHRELSDSVQHDPDPMITPPLYGRWHALTERLLSERDGTEVPNRENWVHDLNLDPRWRAAAGMGTEVIQKNQEAYMEAAWKQIGDVLEANRRIRQAQLAKAASMRLHRAHLEKSATSAGRFLMLTAPLKARVVSNGVTLRHQLKESVMGVALTSSAMRRAVRPGGKLAKQLELTAPADLENLVTRANTGEVSAAPPKVPPKQILTPDDLSEAVAPDAGVTPAALLLPALALLALACGPLGWILAGWLWSRHRSLLAQQAAADQAKEDNFVPASVNSMPGSADFQLVPHVDPRDAPAAVSVQPGESDNAEASRFKTALREQYQLIETSKQIGNRAPPVPLDLRKVATDMVAETRPEVTVPRWTLSGLTIPQRIRDQIGASFQEVMAYPELDIPMYEPLAQAGSELFVPNLHLVERDSVTLLEPNQAFIEAYMVGINHEFSRELMWREYPTDARGSYFRQFWDVRRKIARAADQAAAREKFKDIKRLHEWPPTSDLGKNDNREPGEQAEQGLVLVIRGELLKKYPNAIISAQPAAWQRTGAGRPDKSKVRVLDESAKPVTPLYEARVAPDVFFFGFDLTALQARGDDTVDDEPGWFFRIEEVPGDARFGFDISREENSLINVYNDLSWPDVAPGLADGKPMKVANIPAQTLQEPTGNTAKHDQWQQDSQLTLSADVTAAELAYVALQTPVIMAVHASELLPKQAGPNG
jgi:hypothetical protein